jgi:two-component system, OmpR family, KDP operon response regulator KdpE
VSQRILLVEDEASIRRALELNLEVRGYEVDQAASGESALDHAQRAQPDLIVLDLGLPNMDGIDVIRSLRGWSKTPILVLSARGSESTKVAALDAGADDYITKPFGMDELMARVRAALRRNVPSAETESVVTPDFTLDLAAKHAYTPAGEIKLTATQWRLIEVLVRNHGRLVTHRQLLQEVWGPTALHQTHYLRIFMAQIRQKLEPKPSQPRHFITEAGLGYRFDQ